MRTYSELIQLETFEERFRYLALGAAVGHATFGAERHINQSFYASRAWRELRHEIMIRDDGCDLAFPGYEIGFRPVIHHINPMTVEELEHGERVTLDPENLITTTHRTHNAIHYGDESQLPRELVSRRPGDTKLW